MRNGVVFVSTLAAVTLFGKAYATEPQMLADARCVVVGMNMSALSVPEQRDAGTVIAAYFLGRLDGRSLNVDVPQLIQQEASKMTAEDLRAEAVRCGKTLTEKGQEIARLNAALGTPPKPSN